MTDDPMYPAGILRHNGRHYAVYLDVDALLGQRRCPHCSQLMPGSTPAQDAPAPVKDAHEDAPSGWRERGPLL